MYKKNIETKYISKMREQNRRKGKASKSIFALSVISAALWVVCTPASAQYVEPGQIGNKASWETAEYHADWGLQAMNASSAYALGYYGQGVKVGVMDSGALLYAHADLDGSRFHAVSQSGQYGTSGNRYPQVAPPNDLPYTAGQAFDITGEWVLGVNDGHGTHVTGTVGANRDGSGMHGVSWGSDIYVGNTGATDNNNYGPYQDYNFFYTGWKALVDAGAQVINNSWGTNVRINNTGSTGPDGGNTGVHLPANTIAELEYEYYYFKKMYGEGRSFVDAAYDAVKGTNTVQIFTTGNRDMANPFHRALYPYFHPEAEKHWIAVAGLEQATGGRYELVRTWNEAGEAKWWTVASPGRNIYSTTVNITTGAPGYGNSSGTSMSAPHVAGAMGVLLSRYPNMTAIQVRDVLFTTASNKNPDGTFFNYWTAPDGVPDERYGWGVPDLDKGMYGPGQFLGPLEYNMSTTPLDVWSNNISQVALDARKVEELQWLQDYRNGTLASDPYELGTSFVVNDGNSDPTDHIISLADAQRWRAEYQAERAAAIQAKIDAGLYDGSLVKLGAGTLVMTGDNTYRGGTAVQAGSLYGFTESFGTGTVYVNGGRFGVLSSYNDVFTQKGNLTSTETRKANIEVGNGGTYVVVANENVNVGALTFKEGSKITIDAVDESLLLDAYNNGTSVTGTVTATTLTDFNKAAIPNYAFFNTSLSASGNTITGSLSRNNSVNFASYGTHHNGRTIGTAIDRNPTGILHDTLVTSTIDELRATYDSLGSDFSLNSSNASILNAISTSRTVREQALGIGNGQTASIGDTSTAANATSGNGAYRFGVKGDSRIWITGIGNWSNVDYGQSDMDVDFYAALVGADINITDNMRLGAFFGAGTTKYEGNQHGKIDSDDLHFGLYGAYDIPNTAAITYGVTHTRQDRDASRTLRVGNLLGYNSVSTDAEITQLYIEAAYTGIHTGNSFSVEPYAGLDLIHAKFDGFNETVGPMEFRTDSNKQTLQVGTIGVRGSMPFTMGHANMTIKGDISAMHFFGDNTPEAYMYLANTGRVKLEGGKLDNIFNVGLGIETRIRNTATIGLSYGGSFNGDIQSHGAYLKVRIDF